MATGERTEILFVRAQMSGASAFVCQAQNAPIVEILQARASYVRSTIGRIVSEFCSELSQVPFAAKLRLLDYAGDSLYAFLTFSSASPTQAALDEKTKSFSKNINDLLLEKFRGQLFLGLATKLVGSDGEDICKLIAQADRELTITMRGLQQEPFREQLHQMLTVEQSFSPECTVCRRDQDSLESISFKGLDWMVCDICNEIFTDFLKQSNQNDDHNPASSDLRSNVLKLIANTAWVKSEKRYSKELKSILHFHIAASELLGTSARRLQERLRTNKLTPVLPASEIFALLQKAAALVEEEQEQSDFAIIECNSKDIFVCGKFFWLLELIRQFEELLNKKYPELSTYSAALTNNKSATPVPIRMQTVLAITGSSKRSNEKTLAVSFNCNDDTSCHSFSFDQWRNQIKPLLGHIRSFDQMNALGFGFWDYLYEKARSNDYTIYQLMYKIARREESHQELRKSGRWREFKKEIFLALSSKSKEQKIKRAMLVTALEWHLHYKDSQHPQPQKKELIQLGRS